MFAKKLGLAVSALFLSTSAFARQSDVLVNAGYSNYSGFSDSAFKNNFNGGNLGVTYLYSIMNEKMTPVVGAGLNTHLMRYSNDSGSNLTLNSYEGALKAGAKFNVVDKINAFALLNAGYSFYNYFAASYDKGDLKLKNTYSFGASFIATYDLSESLNVGLGYAYNRRNLNVKDTDLDKNYQYNEHSANVIVGFNF